MTVSQDKCILWTIVNPAQDTIISSFPKNWGCRLGDAPSDVYSSISHRIGALTPAEVTSVHDIALVIIEECSKAMFGQCAARGSLTGMGGLYGYSLSEIVSTLRKMALRVSRQNVYRLHSC